jgi:hypothetical protein
MLVLLITPVPFNTLVRVRVDMAAESKVTGFAPLKVKVKEEELITVLASRVKESASSVKFKESAEWSAAKMVPSRMLVEVITPVPIKALVKVRVEILALSKLTVLPLKDRLKLEPLITVLLSKVSESAKAVKSKVSALRSPFKMVPSRILVEEIQPVQPRVS